MALNIPESASVIDQKIKVDVKSALPESNPYLPNGWLGAMITGFANRFFDFYLQLKEAIKQAFPDTATGDEAERWSSIWGFTRLAATSSIGNIAAIGTVSTDIPINTDYTDTTGAVYQTTAAAVILGQSVSVALLERSGTTVTATTAEVHNLANNVVVSISGAVEVPYNVVDTDIIVISPTVFTYQISATPTTPASGTIISSVVFASVPITAEDFGDDTNQELNTVLTLQSPIAGVDSDAQVDAGLLSGGTNQELDSELQARYIEGIQNPVAQFNVAAIVRKAKEVAGVTRVFVQEITPAVGQVTIYFMRDNEDDPIPTASDITTTKDKILEIKPATTSSDDVFVLAPIAVNQSFTFTALSPNTTSMQTAVTASLEQFFEEQTTVGVSIDEDKYRAAIANTVDTTVGVPIASFTLSLPTGDVIINAGEIGVLNVVTYP